VSASEQRIAAIAASAFDSFDPGAPIEIMSDIAYPVTLAVICEILDTGVELAIRLRHETPRMTAMIDPLAFPAEVEDGVAGHETTANLIGNAAAVLHDCPDALRGYQNKPVKAVVEELLRFEPPVQLTARVAIQPHGPIRAGDQVFVSIVAANRDPAASSTSTRQSTNANSAWSAAGQPHSGGSHGALSPPDTNIRPGNGKPDVRGIAAIDDGNLPLNRISAIGATLFDAARSRRRRTGPGSLELDLGVEREARQQLGTAAPAGVSPG